MRLRVVAWLVFALSVLDLVSTRMVLAAGGGEGNPLASDMLSVRFTLVKLGLAGYLVWRSYARSTIDLLCVACGLAGFYFAIVMLNLLTYQSLI